MRYLVNQKGYALLMVLMLILLFTVLGMGLLAMNMNASKQFNLKEEQVQARHQAEMGVLHYQKELEKYIAANKPTAIPDAVSFCNSITPATVSSAVTDKRYTTTLKKGNCTKTNNVLTIPLESNGVSGPKGTETINAKLYLKIPVTPPEIPEPASGQEKITAWKGCIEEGKNGKENKNNNGSNDKNIKNCNMEYEKFTDLSTITETVVLKKGELEFKDHLILNSLRINGGNGQSIIVEKDLYIKNLLDVQNHSCFAVQGNLTISKKITSKNKLNIYVYGDANLPSDIDFTSPNNNIFVNGDVYFNGILKQPKPSSIGTFSKVAGYVDNGCILPGENESSLKNWSLDDKIDAEYK